MATTVSNWIGFTALTIAALLSGFIRVANADEPTATHELQFVTQIGTALCQSEDDLKTLLALSQSNYKGRVEGCVPSRKNGVPVVILDRDGSFDVWV